MHRPIPLSPTEARRESFVPVIDAGDSHAGGLQEGWGEVARVDEVVDDAAGR